MPTTLVVTGLMLMVCQMAVTVYLVVVIARIARVDARLSHQADALALLTETAESGFGAVAAQMERMAAAPARRLATRSTASRIAGAARRGRSVTDIAVAESVSEGEVRLRLHLAEHGRGQTAAPAQQ